MKKSKGAKLQRERTSNIEHRTSRKEPLLKAFGAEFRASTRRLPAAARRRTIVHRVRAVRQEQRCHRPKEPSKGKVCENCRFSKAVSGLNEAALICENRAGAPKQCIAVKEDEACCNFEYSRDVVSPEIAAALAEGAKLIPLTRDKFAIVDAEDYERLSKYKWHARKKGRRWYAGSQRSKKSFEMHRLILNAPPLLVVDHINHNGLDNRKRNLRLCTAAQNSQNARPRTQPNLTSKYKGVSLDKKRKLFMATITHNKKNIS